MPWLNSSILYYIVPSILLLYAARKFRERKWGKCINRVRLDGKVVIITGANSGIGFETAKELAARGAETILACRNVNSAKEAAEKIKNQLGTSSTHKILPMELNLANLASIKNFVETVKRSHPEIHILINNAAVSYPRSVRKVTDDGFEIHFGVNYLGHFFLTLLLLDTLKKSKPSRIIIVSSMLHEKAKLNIDDLNAENAPESINLYASSKLANIYFCRELARQLENSGVNVYTLCPGWVYTGLFRNYKPKWYHYIAVAPIAFFFMKSAKQGAQTVVYCATEPKLIEENGFLYRDCKPYNSKYNFNNELGVKLWETSKKMLVEKGML